MIEIRDADETRLLVAQGLWLQRVVPPSPATVKPTLSWVYSLAAEGQLLPPPGLVADLGHVAFAADADLGRDAVTVPGLPPGLLRTYEDHVLGKLYGDWTFARAADVLRRLDGDRPRARGLGFVLEAFRGRAGFATLALNPAVVKGLLDVPPAELLGQGWEALTRDGLASTLEDLYGSLIASCRRTAEVLSPEDVFELEHGTALAEFGERHALRQVLRAAADLEALLPQRKPRPLAGRREVPTRVLDEDTYPVGGFASLATRGSIESLLHSQLAYMERVGRPDLFDIKFLRDELLYYGRDENQFLRRRRVFVVALYPDLIAARHNVSGLERTPLVLLLGLVVAAARRLTDWLSGDALVFEILFVDDAAPLAPEQALLKTVFREGIENKSVVVDGIASGDLTKACADRARRSLVHVLTASAQDRSFEAADAVVTRLVVDGANLAVAAGDEGPVYNAEEEPFDAWAATLLELLQRWV